MGRKKDIERNGQSLRQLAVKVRSCGILAAMSLLQAHSAQQKRSFCVILRTRRSGRLRQQSRPGRPPFSAARTRGSAMTSPQSCHHHQLPCSCLLMLLYQGGTQQPLRRTRLQVPACQRWTPRAESSVMCPLTRRGPIPSC